MYSHGNNGNNLDLMVSVRYEPAKHEITGHAWLQLQKLKDEVSSVTTIELYNEPTHIKVKDLITVYKWLPQLCNMATFLPIFSEVIDNDRVKIEDVPKFDILMYKVMGE